MIDAYVAGDAAEQWRWAGLYFDAKDYAQAARLLAEVVEHSPSRSGRGCCWPAPTTTRPSSPVRRSSCAR
ncbi:hypothetical protein GCM10025734_71330 [Kitasatospora paranensis]